jgi:hypothetical protein
MAHAHVKMQGSEAPGKLTSAATFSGFPSCRSVWVNMRLSLLLVMSLSISQSDNWDTRQDVYHHIITTTRHHRVLSELNKGILHVHKYFL